MPDTFVISTGITWTRENLRQYAQALYGETSTSYVGSTVWDMWANAVIDEMVSLAGGISGTTTTSTTDGIALYDSDRRAFGIEDVLLNGTSLIKKTRAEMDKQMVGWKGAAEGTPTHWIPWGISSSGIYQIRLHPVPSTTGSNDLVIWWVGKPAWMTADSDTPVIPATYGETIAYGMCFRAALRDTDRDRGGRIAAQFGTLYKQGLDRFQADVNILGAPWKRIANEVEESYVLEDE